jgi:hypothetical protein
MKTKLINFTKHILLKIYFKLDRKHTKTYKEWLTDRVMAEFHY